MHHARKFSVVIVLLTIFAKIVFSEPTGLTAPSVAGPSVSGFHAVGLLLTNVSDSRVSDCLIRDDRPKANSKTLEFLGGHGNMIVDNLLGDSP